MFILVYIFQLKNDVGMQMLVFLFLFFLQNVTVNKIPFKPTFLVFDRSK